MPKSLARLFSNSSSSVPPSRAHEIKTPIDEELIAGDRIKYFHPTKPGDVLDGRFKILAKLGFGGGSTVWLAENLKSCDCTPLSMHISLLTTNVGKDGSAHLVYAMSASRFPLLTLTHTERSPGSSLFETRIPRTKGVRTFACLQINLIYPVQKGLIAVSSMSL
jgi:hypothetical protein